MLWASTREPRKSRVVVSVCSRARYTRNPSLDIDLLSVVNAGISQLLAYILKSEA